MRNYKGVPKYTPEELAALWRKPILEVPEAAALLRVSLSTVYEYCRHTSFYPARRYGARIRINSEDLRRWDRERSNGPSEPESVPRAKRLYLVRG